MKLVISFAMIAMFGSGVFLGYEYVVLNTPATQVVNICPTTPIDLMKKAPTIDQEHLLAVAYSIAQSDGIEPRLLQGIMLQETLAGALPSYKVAGQEAGLKTNQRYYGVMQVKLDAAKDVLKRYSSLWSEYGFHTHMDEEIIAKLIENDTFNIAIASKYLLILRDRHGYKTTRAMAVAYNKGPGGAAGVNMASDPYAVGVVRHMRLLPSEVGVYHVVPGDSLNAIATRLGASVDALFEANPAAFIEGNRDLLMAGVDLKIPESKS